MRKALKTGLVVAILVITTALLSGAAAVAGGTGTRNDAAPQKRPNGGALSGYKNTDKQCADPWWC